MILTTKANESMILVHDRMPLILERGEIEDWIQRDERLLDFLGKTPIELVKKQDYEQQSFFM